MKKFLIIFFILIFTTPSYAWFGSKKDSKLEAEMEGKGYAGTLPNLNKVFQKKEEKITTPIFESQKGFDDPTDLKPTPTDDPSFVNIIQRKDKTSTYVLDATEMIKLLERLEDTIENEETLQLFITRANIVTMNIDYLIEKYTNQPEYYYQSFTKLMSLNRNIKTIEQLRKEAVVYQRYLAYQTSGSIYNPENINRQLEYLKEEINNTILALKSEE